MTISEKSEVIQAFEDVRRLIIAELGASVYLDEGGSLTRCRRPELDSIDRALRIVAAQQGAQAATKRAPGTWGDV